jgi:5-methylcytosine-specific restriction endonuclease McrA
MSKYKVCNACNQAKSLDDFHIHKASPDGLRYQCKPCRKVERNARYEVNKEHELAVAKAYRDANPELTKQWSDEYYQSHREKVISRQVATNKLNRPRINAYLKKWRNLNPGYGNVYSRARDRRKRANGYELYTESQVLETYGTTCHLCGLAIDLELPRRAGIDGWEQGLHIDHLIPVSKGGPDTLENVRPAHGLCNLKKNNKEG